MLTDLERQLELNMTNTESENVRRCIWVDEALWDACERAAQHHSLNRSKWIRTTLQKAVKRKRRKKLKQKK